MSAWEHEVDATGHFQGPPSTAVDPFYTRALNRLVAGPNGEARRAQWLTQLYTEREASLAERAALQAELDAASDEIDARSCRAG